MRKTKNSWLYIALYDLETAQAMLKTGRYLYVAFMCHQSIEKLLKAIICKKTAELPPFTHNLVLLAKLTGVEFSNEQSDFFAIINPYNIEARYPKTKEDLKKLCKKNEAGIILDKTKELFKWLKQKLN